MSRPRQTNPRSEWKARGARTRRPTPRRVVPDIEGPTPRRVVASLFRHVGKEGMNLLRLLLRPLGYLAFVVALLALSGAAKILGDRHELGFFSGRLARMLWRYPEVTRPGVQIAWLVWAALLVIAVSPIDPIASSWDEVALGALAVIVLWLRTSGGQQAGR
jgi:hypothetical protein